MATVVVIVFSFAVFGYAPSKPAGGITVKSSDCIIVTPADATSSQTEAAEELQKHLALISGRKPAIVPQGERVEGGYPFYVGITPPENTEPLAPEEARWTVTPAGTYLYTSEEGYGRGGLYAVYAFLEDQLGVRWIEPGDVGIAYQEQSPLKLRTGRFNWVPVLRKRWIRMRDREQKEPSAYKPQGDLAYFTDFVRSMEEVNTDAREGRKWQMRMRMGSHDPPNYGHAFTDWWDKYGKTHPEYFALNRQGKREPEFDPYSTGAVRTAESPFTRRERSFVKLCVSNPKVVDQIVQNWLAEPRRSNQINVCMNDHPEGFCRCPNCLALDDRKKGQPLGDYLDDLSDRYVYFANAVAREARKHDPQVRVVMYAYNATEFPPHKQRLDPNVTVALVPTTFELPKLQKLLRGWKQAGATEILIRPNLHWYWTLVALPMGYEKQWYDLVQLVVENNGIGFDFDCIKRNWPTTGMANYILAKAMSDPSKPFAYWEDHYCSAYGAAARYVKRYYQYWRVALWEKRLRPDIDKLLIGRDANFCRALLKKGIGNYYRVEDFDRTYAILQAAAEKDLTTSQREKLDRLILASQQARLLYEAITTPRPEKLQYAKMLLDFRRKYGNGLGVTWITIFASELPYTDTGLVDVAKQSQP